MSDNTIPDTDSESEGPKEEVRRSEGREAENSESEGPEEETVDQQPTNRLGVDSQVLTLAIARMAESIGNSFLIIVLPLFIASDFVTGGSFGFSEVAITGIVLSLFGLVNSSLQPVTGRLSDRTGRRKAFVLIGLGILAGASVAFAFATTYWQLVGLRAIQGVAGAFIVPASVAFVNDVATDENRGGNMGTYNAFRLLGFGVGPIGAGVVVATGPYSIGLGGSTVAVTGFEASFYFAAVTALVGFVLVSLFVRDPDIESNESTAQRDSIAVFDRTGRSLLDPVFTLGVVSLLTAASIAMFATLGDVINTRLDQGSQLFGLQFAAFVFAHIVLQAPIGRATDFYGRKRFIVVGLVLLVPTTAVQGVILDSWFLFAARFAQGAAGAMVFSPAMALAGDLAPESESGSTLSVVTMSFGFGIALGPLLSGLLVRFGFVVPFAVGAALAGIGAGLVQSQVREVVTPTRSTPVSTYSTD